MAGPNGTAGTHADPTGVFGRVGAALTLGGVERRVRILTNRQVKEQNPLLDALPYLLGAGQTVGVQFYEGVCSDERQGKPDAWERLAAWLSAWLTEPLSADDLQDATPDQVIAAIDTIFEQSGLAWLRRQLGNAAVAAALARPQPSPSPESAPGGTGKGSTTSTISSSTPPDPRPAPESSTPSTG